MEKNYTKLEAVEMEIASLERFKAYRTARIEQAKQDQQMIEFYDRQFEAERQKRSDLLEAGEKPCEVLPMFQGMNADKVQKRIKRFERKLEDLKQGGLDRNFKSIFMLEYKIKQYRDHLLSLAMATSGIMFLDEMESVTTDVLVQLNNGGRKHV